MAGRNYSEQTIKQLFGSAAGRCCFPTCRRSVIFPATEHSKTTITGDIAHIKAFSDSGPRSDASLDAKTRNEYDNLLLLCAACHRLVDGQPEEYPDDVLSAMKGKHLDWVNGRLATEMSNLDFSELEVICKAIASEAIAPSSGLIVVPPAKKMKANSLGRSSAKKIQMGLMQAPQVSSYLEKMAAYIDSEFPGRLVSGFRVEYEKCWASGLRGDNLFTMLEFFAAGDSRDFERHAAGLAVIAHLFQICDLFEKTEP